MSTMVFPSFVFRFAHTGISIRYSVNVQTTMYTFVKNMTHNIMIDFDIRNDSTIEIVENGKKEGEFGPVVEPSNIPFHQYYPNRTPHDLSFSFFLKKIIYPTN